MFKLLFNQVTQHNLKFSKTLKVITLGSCIVSAGILPQKSVGKTAEKYNASTTKIEISTRFNELYEADAFIFRKKKNKKILKDTVKKNNDSIAEYKKLLKDAVTKKGLFITHQNKKGKLYLEIPNSAFSHYYILANRMDATSNNQDFVAGQMITTPLLIKLSRDNNRVYMHIVQTTNIINDKDPIISSYKKNFKDPILKGFKIEANNGNNCVIDVTDFFAKNENCISPLSKDGSIAAIFGGKKALGGSYMSEASGITEVKNFPKNIEIKSRMSFSPSSKNDDPYTVEVHRSFFMLPDTLMKSRIYDTRLGIFFSFKRFFNSNKDNIELRGICHRWRIEPKEEDLKKYMAGELVEPKKQIVFYVDNAFPEKWRKTIHQGIEDWNLAFAKAGFKNVVVAKDYPKDDPSFDPDDMRYNCVKYAVTSTANAMGPSYVDPRSGEILNADVIWYHNVISLLHNWRFTQTAAVDARTRNSVFSDSLMCESIRYAIAHEVGHTMGLMHNMGASHAFDVDSLRSPSFTQKYGTTPSIMDYARNNYIAQPGDMEKGVKLTPPRIGVYDMYAINWLYRLIPQAKSPEEEVPTLNKWIDEKRGDKMFEYGPQQIFSTVDPTDQIEDLGNDHIKAGDYAISNLKIIMKNLYDWTKQPGERYDPMMDIYKEVVKQYGRHIQHVIPYIGGVEYKDLRQGEKGYYQNYYSKNKQKKALIWLVNQARTYDNWLTPTNLINNLFLTSNENNKIREGIVASLFNGEALFRIREGEKIDNKKNYKLDDYLQDAVTEIFKPSIQGKQLTPNEMQMQDAAIFELIKGSGLKLIGGGSKSLNTDERKDALNEFLEMCKCEKMPCQYHEEDYSFIRINYGLPTLPIPLREPLMARQLRRIQSIYQQNMHNSDKATNEFYKYQLLKIGRLFKL